MQALIYLLAAFLILQTHSLHLLSPQQSWISPDGKQWSGYNPDCSFACAQSGGEECQSFPKTCCSKGKCTSEYSILTCSAKQANFNCTSVKRGVVFNSPDVPELNKLLK